MGCLVTIPIVFIISLFFWPDTPVWFKMLFALVYGLWLFLIACVCARLGADADTGESWRFGKLRSLVAFALTFGTISLIEPILGPVPPAPAQPTAVQVQRAMEPAATEVSSKQEVSTALLREGLDALATDDYAGAIGHLTRAIAIDPTCAACYEARGMARTYSGDLEGAVADYDLAIEIEPGQPTAHNARGMLRSYLGRFDEAVADFDSAIKGDPSNAAYYYNRGCTHNQMDRYEEAIEYLTKAITAGLAVNSGEARYQRAWAYHRIGNDSAAIHDLEKAIELDESSEFQTRAREALEALAAY